MGNKENIYAKWLEGSLDPEEVEALRKSGELEELEKIIQSVDRLSLKPFPMDEAYHSFMQDRPAKLIAFRRKSVIWASAIAASIALLVAAYFLFWTSTVTISPQLAETQYLDLDDGSTIILNDGSSLSYRKGFFQPQRKVKLRGEAWFKVSPGSPFIVYTPKGSIEVLGTAFNVRSWGSSLKVECYEGKVAVKSNMQETILNAGEGLMIDQNQSIKSFQTTDNEPSWKNGSSTFNNDPASLAFEELERQFNVEVKFELKDRLFTGSFTHDKLALAMQQLCLPLQLNYRFNSDSTLVTIFE